MYAALRKYALRTYNRDEVRRAIETEFVPRLRQIRGFRAYYLVDSGSDELLTISLFEGRAGAEESVRVAATWVKENAIISRSTVGVPEVTGGEVSIAVVADPAGLQARAA